MNALKIGLLGTGHRGRNGWQAHQPEKGVTVVAGADVSSTARSEFQEKFPDAAVFEDWHEVLKMDEIGAVFISTPDFLHEEMTLAALKAGKAVYLEKPMAITIEGCDRILKKAMETGSKLFVGHNMRYFPMVLKMRELIQSGIIGEVQVGWVRHFVGYGGDAYFRDWHSERRNTTGLLLQKGAHDIDVIHWLMGTYTRSVVGMGMLSVYNRCQRRSPDTPGVAAWSGEHYPPLELGGFSPIIDVEDHSMIMMQMENGTQATYMQCHYAPDAERNYTFIGTRGRIENIGDYGDCQIHVWTTRGPRATPDVICHLKPVEGNHGGSDAPIVDDFLNFVMHDGRTNTSPVAARNAVAAGVLGTYSIRNGNNRQDIPPLDPELIAYFDNNQKK